MSCVPTINVTSVTVDTSATTHIATLMLDAPLPMRGPFKLRLSNCSGAELDPNCITPCNNPQAQVQMRHEPLSVGAVVTYSAVYNAPQCGRGIPDIIKLSQVIKQAARNCGILNGKSSYGTSKAVFLTDCLPPANASITVTTSAPAA